MLREKSRKCNFETLRFLLLFISIRHVGCVILFYRGGIFVKLCKTLRYLFIREAYSSGCAYTVHVLYCFIKERHIRQASTQWLPVGETASSTGFQQKILWLRNFAIERKFPRFDWFSCLCFFISSSQSLFLRPLVAAWSSWAYLKKSGPYWITTGYIICQFSGAQSSSSVSCLM